MAGPDRNALVPVRLIRRPAYGEHAVALFDQPDLALRDEPSHGPDNGFGCTVSPSRQAVTDLGGNREHHQAPLWIASDRIIVVAMPGQYTIWLRRVVEQQNNSLVAGLTAAIALNSD
jgi:hypothetical protein